MWVAYVGEFSQLVNIEDARNRVLLLTEFGKLYII
jgi:hypothetical protein